MAAGNSETWTSSCGRIHLGLAVVRNIPVISIIDDDEAVRVATQSLLRSLGFDTHTFASAEDFLQSARVRDSSCVITDVQMPGLSGVELQDRLRAQGHRTPVIFLTAFPDEKMRTQAMNAGAVCFLSKPFDCATLITCLDTALKSA